jgi:hypothetical protein
MQEYLYGSLTLAATTPLHQLPVFNDTRTVNGNLTGYRGSYSLLMPQSVEKEVAIQCVLLSWREFWGIRCQNWTLASTARASYSSHTS